MPERKQWVDLLRGVCMMAILWDHTEIYMSGRNIIPYAIYVTDALVVFFFLSGYLMFKANGFDIKHKMKSICRTLLLPYFIFTIVITITKTWVRGQQLVFPDLVTYIGTGQASWFIAALITAEIIFSIVLHLCREKIGAVAIVSFTLSGILLAFHDKTDINFWQIENALLAVLFLFSGYAYHRFESHLKILSRPLYLLIGVLLMVVIKVIIYTQSIELYINPIAIRHYPLFLLNVLVSILVLTSISKKFPNVSVIQWTGRNSIVYYFLSGAVPMITQMLFAAIGLTYNHNYMVILAAFAVVYLLASVLTWIVCRYAPFIIGRF
jgi:fucose 4-O-acetylase-like acetyltransferase